MTDRPLADTGALIISPDDVIGRVVACTGVTIIAENSRGETFSTLVSEAVLVRPAPGALGTEIPVRTLWCWDNGWNRMVPVEEAWDPEVHPRDQRGRFSSNSIKLVDDGPMTSITVDGENRGSIFPADLLGGPSGSWSAVPKGIGGQQTFSSRDEAIAHVTGLEVQQKAETPYDKTPSSMPSMTSSAGTPTYIGNDALHLVRPADDQFDRGSPEAKAIRDYTDVQFKEINAGLRRGRGLNSDTVKNLDAAFAQVTPTTYEMTVKRVINNGDELFGELGSRVGDSHHERAYVSTSTGGGIGGGSDATIMTIEIPPGTQVIRPGSIGNHGDTEGEILLNRDSSYDIVDDTMVGSTRQVKLRMRSKNVSEAATHPPPYEWSHGWKPLNAQVAKKYGKPWSGGDSKKPAKKETPLEKLHRNAKEFDDNSGEVGEMSAEEAQAQLDELIDFMDDPEFGNDKGVKFTMAAIEDAAAFDKAKLIVANVDGVGFGGALSMHRRFDESLELDHYYVEYAGSTGMSKGTGSALAREAARIAARDGLPIIGQASDADALRFWESVGWRTDPMDLGTPDVLGWTPDEVKKAAIS